MVIYCLLIRKKKYGAEKKFTIMTHRHKGLTMEVEKHKNNDVSTMRMSQEENNITINVTLQTTNPKRHNVMVRKLYNSIICISYIASICF